MKNILEQIIDWVILSSRRFENKPGVVIEKLSQSMRQELADLKSDDIRESSQRKDYWKLYSTSEDYDKEIEYRRILTDFDEKILK